MRLPHRYGALALTALLMASACSTVQVSRPPAPTAEPAPVVVDRSTHWRFDAGNRPPAERDGYRPPNQLAVLLPLSGTLATAAAPVRDGLLAGYYAENRRRPELRFYDTTGTTTGALAAYERAVADGADQVLGPLGKDQVEAVFRQARTGVPVLALNRPDVAPPMNNASYALAPEDDGVGAADFLQSRGAARVLVLSAGDDNARRSVEAFGKRLQQHGGSIVQTLAVVGDSPADMTELLRAAALREGGVDAVFLAMRGPQARAIAPQLSAAGLAGKPRVATSQLTSGTGKADQDRILDGIAFPTDAWSVSGVSGLPAASTTGSGLPTARGPAARLFAFGYDAWLLTAYLERLALVEDGSVRGASGTLRIDADGNVMRNPAWSTFSSGNIVPLMGSGG
ncbi:penicillin-binding protein activator [Luteimonas vadosa]|uniref:LppC family lipoprotein n=1 Tax=Luteimonas vadosa TaxID=1165507 RepID=A0ABP9DMN8_9GAMM